MANKRPAFQRYPKDYLSDEHVALMTLEEEGAYNRLMDHCWLEGDIPDDPALLRALCKHIPQKRMERIWECLRPRFRPRPKKPGRMVHPRLEIERRKQDEHKKARSRAGTRGAKARWEKEENGSAIVLPMAKDSSSPATASATASSSLTKPSCLPPVSGRHEFSPYLKQDKAVILEVWHLGEDTITVNDKPVSMELEMHIHRQLCLARGEEEIHGALPFIRQAEPEIGADVSISLRLAEARPEVLNRCIGLWHKSTLGKDTAV